MLEDAFHSDETQACTSLYLFSIFGLRQVLHRLLL